MKNCQTDDYPSQPGGDQDDPGSGDGRDDGDGRGRSDYDYDEECPDGDGGSGEHHSRVAVRPSSSRLFSSFRRLREGFIEAPIGVTTRIQTVPAVLADRMEHAAVQRKAEPF